SARRLATSRSYFRSRDPAGGLRPNGRTARLQHFIGEHGEAHDHHGSGDQPNNAEGFREEENNWRPGEGGCDQDDRPRRRLGTDSTTCFRSAASWPVRNEAAFVAPVGVVT